MLLVSAFILSGCITTCCVLNGVDYLFTQSPKPIPGLYKMTISNRDNGDSVTCFAEIEHFYDGGASARGNRWEVRYKEGNTPKPLKTKTAQGLPLEVPFPLASRLLDWEFPHRKNYAPSSIYLTLDQDEIVLLNHKSGEYFFTARHGEKILIELNLHIDIERVEDWSTFDRSTPRAFTQLDDQ
jgi:hypothetical protein